MTACIADFGLSSMLGDLQAGTTYLAATAMYPGAVRWTAPELLESDDLQPTTVSDIYSLGSIMLQVGIPKGLERPKGSRWCSPSAGSIGKSAMARY
jgi:serine/threonine protein kinase